jgi:hypothetical protein
MSVELIQAGYGNAWLHVVIRVDSMLQCVLMQWRIFFISRQVVPKVKIVTYGRFVVDIRPNKTETHRVRLTVGGNLIQYPGDLSTRSADLTTSKCLWNSTISTHGDKCMCLDVKHFYLGNPMDSFEYIHIPIKLIPQDIIVQYNLLTLV